MLDLCCWTAADLSYSRASLRVLSRSCSGNPFCSCGKMMSAAISTPGFMLILAVNRCILVHHGESAQGAVLGGTESSWAQVWNQATFPAAGMAGASQAGPS